MHNAKCCNYGMLSAQSPVKNVNKHKQLKETIKTLKVYTLNFLRYFYLLWNDDEVETCEGKWYRISLIIIFQVSRTDGVEKTL